MNGKRFRGGLVAAMMAATAAGGCASPSPWEEQRAEEARMARLVARAVRRDPRLAGCVDLAKVDFEALRRREAAEPRLPVEEIVRREDEEHRLIRGPLGAFSPPADAVVALSVAAGATGHQEVRTATSSHVWKGADGVWRVNRVDDVDRPPPPPPPGAPGMTEADLQRARRQTTEGVLAPATAARLDRALDDVCLSLQPDVLPMDAPLLDGTNDFCWGGNGDVVVIRRGGTTRVITDGCARHVGGEVIRAVMYVRPAGEGA